MLKMLRLYSYLWQATFSSFFFLRRAISLRVSLFVDY